MIKNCFIEVVIFMILLMKIARGEDEYITSRHDQLDEWHMDYVPTGYLPDSVYRELAWYGILQLQPLYRSTKHKVAARWVWQNTLGRPQVLVENQKSTDPDGGAITSHQTTAEESAKWSRERRLAQDVLMENIRSGGNGLTVRTVVSATQKTVYIIQNGKYYHCEGSEPDMEAFRTQANMHERTCTDDKEAVLLPVDPCLDAEAAPLEYCPYNLWSFCLGDAERNALYSSDGQLDCGNKTKVHFSKFLEQCAIDYNVVIQFEYFGDEPRKDIVHNSTLCTSWDPCRLSYLYRIEPPTDKDIPIPLTESVDPCDTTLCPDCLVSEKSAPPIRRSHDLFEWVPRETSREYNNEVLKDKALTVGYSTRVIPNAKMYPARINYNGTILPAKWAHAGVFYASPPWTSEKREIRWESNRPFEVAYLKTDPKNVKWVSASYNTFPECAVSLDIPYYNGKEDYYMCRADISRENTPGQLLFSTGKCTIPFFGRYISLKNYEVLCYTPPSMKEESIEEEDGLRISSD